VAIDVIIICWKAIGLGDYGRAGRSRT